MLYTQLAKENPTTREYPSPSDSADTESLLNVVHLSLGDLGFEIFQFLQPTTTTKVSAVEFRSLILIFLKAAT